MLENNTQFNNTAYRQLTGTAMGTSLSAAYANIFMGQLKERILAETPLEIILYKRYNDDILIITNNTQTQLDNFLQNPTVHLFYGIAFRI